MEFIVWVEHFILRPSYNTKEMIAKVIPMSNSTSMALFPFRALVLSIVSIRMELNGLTWQFAHVQRRETLPLIQLSCFYC